MELYEKIQKCIHAIMSDNLQNVSLELKDLDDRQMDQKANRMLFRALIYLSHTAERTKPSETEIGKQIFNIADNLCYSLNEIPDLYKYFSSLYYIIRKLIAMKLYPEAMRTTTWSFPNKSFPDLTSQHLDMYPKIADLWREPGIAIIDALPRSKSPKTDYKLLVELLANELKLLEIVAKERSAVVLCRIMHHLIKLDEVSANFGTQGYGKHRFVIEHFLQNTEFTLNEREKYEAYHEALRFVNSATIAVVNRKSIGNAPAVFTQSCNMVKTIFHKDLELAACFSIYKNVGVMLLKPVDNEFNKISHWEIERIESETIHVTKSFKNGRGISWDMKMIAYILQSLFDRWDECVMTKDQGFLDYPVLRDILRFIKLMFFILNSIETNCCEICRDNNCKMVKNTHTVTVVSIRSLVIISKILDCDLLKDLFTPIKELLEENVAAIFEMKESNCAQWSSLWSNCGINIYNLSVTYHKTFYEATVFLFSLLCSCVVKFEGINVVNSKINIKDPLSSVLHRLSSVHFNNGNYREALTPCALNGLLSYQNSDSKAFRMWASVKHSCVNSKKIFKTTMISCLREDINVIKEIGVNVHLRDYDLDDLCLRELRGLHEGKCDLSIPMQSVLDEMDMINSGGLEYAQGVHLLAYHQLNYQYDENFPRYLNRAIKKLKGDEGAGDLKVLASASLHFCTFVVNLRKIVDQTKSEMENARFALRANSKSSMISNEGQPKLNDTVVPAYTKINITEDTKLFTNLQNSLNQWNICIENNIIAVIEKWHSVLILRTLIIVAEYCRLHKFSMLENKAWELSLKIASQLKDYRTCVYVVGRSISLRNFNGDWINTANDALNELKPSSDVETDNSISFFFNGLSNLYFHIGKSEEAIEIIHKVLSLSHVTPTKNVPGYLSSLDIIMRNYGSFVKDNRSKNLMVYMVKYLYSMLTIMEYTPYPRIGAKERQLQSFEVLLTCTENLSLRMNSLLSFKEISSHIMNRLKLSQSSGATLRVAECLKNLCFIDLSRMQLDDCVVKVQGLEYILQTEYIEESQKTENPKTSTNELDKPGARDPRMNDASPVLRKTVFKIPEFITHANCSCYKCSSIDYQYLVLSNTHIRAKLYFLQGHLEEASQHFNGAFYLRRKILEKEMSRKIKLGELQKEDNEKRYISTDYNCNIGFVLLLIDFSRFIRKLGFDDAIDVAIEAVNICENLNLQHDPVYSSAKELLLEYQFCAIIKEDDFAKFTVPEPSKIDITKFTQSTSTLDSSGILTPASKPLVRKPRTMRRIKTPPLLKLTKISMNLSEDEDEDEGGSDSPKSSYQRSKVGKNYRRQRTVTRKKLQKYLEASPDASSTEDEEDKGAVGFSGLKIAENFIAEDSFDSELDIVETSDLEEKATMQAQRNALTDKKYNRAKTSSRITRSRSGLSNAPSKLKDQDNSDTVSTSDPEELPETLKRGDRGQKSKTQVSSSRTKKSDTNLRSKSTVAATTHSSDTQEEQDHQITQLKVPKESKAKEKKQPASRRPTSSRPKLKK